MSDEVLVDAPTWRALVLASTVTDAIARWRFTSDASWFERAVEVHSEAFAAAAALTDDEWRERLLRHVNAAGAELAALFAVRGARWGRA
jgi:hypothetical protein